jgi:molybdopterin molybdotransferase
MRSAGKPVPGHLSVDRAIAWIDAKIARLASVNTAVGEACGRVAAQDIRAARPIPPADRAALDGFAVRADSSLGASAYNPLEIPMLAVASGDALPAGMDAVVPLDCVETDGRDRITVNECVAPGDNVERQGATAPAGTVLVRARTPLAVGHAGLLALAGFAQLPVIRQPRVRILIAEPVRPGASEDSNGPMLRAAIARDGGVVEEFAAVERSEAAFRNALVEPGADIVLVVGGTGPGVDDHSAAALAASGELAVHGVALRPGETTGLGRTGDGVPVVLLPGTPASCLWSYELFAGRAIRRLGGRSPELPYRSREMIAARKFVSSIGVTEICPVRCSVGDGVEPLPSFAEIGLMAAVAADGFVIVPETSEGHPRGAPVTVYLYEG